MLKAIRYFYLQIVHLQKYLESKYFVFNPLVEKFIIRKTEKNHQFPNENLNKT